MHGAPDSLTDMPLAEVAARLGATTPAPGGGSAAGIACALAAALVEMTAGFAGGGCAEVGARAAQLRANALALADRDRLSYEPVLAAIRRPADEPGRAEAIAAALADAAATPLAIVRAASETAA